MRVALYARFSTATQDRTSIDGQIANCEALAGREGLEVVARYHDEARSGNDDRRDGYRALLEALERGEFAGIVCDETSRITRNQAELHRLVAELRFRDQYLLTCDGIDTRSESSELVLSVKAAIDQMEGRKTGYRTYRALRERHKAGHSAGGRIYGYSSESTADGYRRRVVDPEQAPVVLEIFERYAAGESAKRIATDLNARRVPSPGSYWNRRKRRAVGWSHTTLLGSYAKASGILRNPIYAGRVNWNKRRGKKVPGTAQRIQTRRPDAEWVERLDESLRIVSDDLWGRAQARLRAARRANHAANLGGRPARHLLSGLLVCGSCGGRYVVCNAKAYGCSSRGNGRGPLCEQRRLLRRDLVEHALLSGIKKQLLAPSTVRTMSKHIAAEVRKTKKPDATRQRIKELDRQIADLVETLLDVGRSEALSAKLRTLEQERRALAKLMHTRTNTEELVIGIADQWRGLVANLERLPKRANTAELEEARQELHELVGEVLVVEEGGGVFAYPKLNAGAVYSLGAEERT